jgi:GGDEF domain-containing protein
VENGRAVTLYGLKQDITAERQQWARRRHLTDYDPLTGLPTEALPGSFFDRSVASGLFAPPGALALFAVDNLAEINRRWGYAAGDACLIAFARRLLSAGDGGAFGAPRRW